MSKLLFLGDLHGNMTATLAMQQEIERIQPDDIWFMGDAVGKGPSSDLTCDWVRQNCRHFIGGNWDINIARHRHDVEDKFGNSFYAAQLGDERLDWLMGLPLEAEVTISGFTFRLVHGRPLDQLYLTDASEEKMQEGFTSKQTGKGYTGLISADCHMPYVRATHLGYAMNTGSIGNSLGVTRAHALLIEGEIECATPAPIRMEIVSVPYDNQKEVEIATKHNPKLPRFDCYVREITTGYYSR